jgi:hypothetical protein
MARSITMYARPLSLGAIRIHCSAGLHAESSCRAPGSLYRVEFEQADSRTTKRTQHNAWSYAFWFFASDEPGCLQRPCFLHYVAYSTLLWRPEQEHSGATNRSPSMRDNREDTLTRVREYQRVLEGLSRIGAGVMRPDRLMHHVAAQVSRVTHIERTNVMKHGADKGDLLERPI